MNAKEVNTTFDLVSHIGGIVSLKKHGAYFCGPCPMCGGKDRFQVKHRANGDSWICRKCAGDKYHSPLDFLMAYHNVDFKEALRMAGGEVKPGKPVTPPAPVQVLPSDEWQAHAWQLINSANDRLLESEEGEPGRRYLLARGFSLASMYRFLLGFDPAKYDSITRSKRPAIAIPYTDVGNIITAVKYRFIDELSRHDKHKRFTMLTDSMPVLFGCRDILESDTTLLFCEGELNAISILQTCPRGVSVVSAGSEGNGNAAIIKALARHYNRVVIWTDDPAKGKIVRDRMSRPDARLLKSPVMDGIKYDANEMLKRGLLDRFISEELKTECQGVPVDLDVIEYMKSTI